VTIAKVFRIVKNNQRGVNDRFVIGVLARLTPSDGRNDIARSCRHE
jgi:hypothetical protein